MHMLLFSSLFISPLLRIGHVVLAYRVRCMILCSLRLGWFLVILVVLQEEVIAGHGKCPNKNDEFSEVNLAVVI